MASFQYDPIDPAKQEIRLVKFGMPAEPGQPLRLTIVTRSLLDDPEYCALSYTWGAPFDGLPAQWDDPAATHLIYINDQKFDVRWNLEAGLRYLDAPDRLPSSCQFIWIDAICIQQSDEEEKSFQVHFMKTIYQSAIYTLVWLGPASNDSDLAMESVEYYCDAWNNRNDAMKTASVNADHKTEYEACVDEELFSSGSQDRLIAIMTFFLRRWWERAWIAQEVAVSPHSIFCCGSASPISWTWLKWTWDLFQQHHRSLSQSSHGRAQPIDFLVSSLLKAGFNFGRIGTLRYNPGTEPTRNLPEVLSFLRESDAQDQRDKVYAFLGLAKDVSMISVSYKLTAAEVYNMMARNWIKAENNLHILGYCFPSTLTGLASWAVDWSIQGASSRQPLFQRKLSGNFDKETNQTIYAAGGSSPLSIRFEDNSNVLVLKGSVLDKIEYVGELPESVQFRSMFEGRRNIRPLEQQQAYENIKHVELGDLARCKWILEWFRSTERFQDYPTFRFKDLPEGSPLPLDDNILDETIYLMTGESARSAFYNTCAAGIYLDDNREYSCRAPNGFENGNPPDFENMFYTIGCMAMERTFMASSKGLMGIGPESVATGDLICIIAGNDTPLLLRPGDNGRLSLVGECYVHGIMDGEAMNIQEERLPWSDLIIT